MDIKFITENVISLTPKANLKIKISTLATRHSGNNLIKVIKMNKIIFINSHKIVTSIPDNFTHKNT